MGVPADRTARNTTARDRPNSQVIAPPIVFDSSRALSYKESSSMHQVPLSSVLSPFIREVETRYRPPTQGDIDALRRRVEDALGRAHVLITSEIRDALHQHDFHTPRGLERLAQIVERPASDRTGRATSSYLAMRMGGRAEPREETSALLPSEAAKRGQPAASDPEARAQVMRLIEQRIGELDRPTNRALLEALADRIAKDARAFSCDLVNGCRGSGRGLDAIEARYSSAFAIFLARIGIKFTPGWVEAKIQSMGTERLEIALRGSPEAADAFSRETGGMMSNASRDQVVEWFMKRAPDSSLLRALMSNPPLSTNADRVAESIVRGLVTDACPRTGDDGEAMSRQIGNFGWNGAPTDHRGEVDENAARTVSAAYARLGMTFHRARQQTFELKKNGTVEHARLAHEIRIDDALSKRFEADTKMAARDASASDLVDWFRKTKHPLDQVARMATHDLPDSPEAFAKEELRRLLFNQTLYVHPVSTMLIVVGNTGASYLDPDQRRRTPELAAAAESMMKNLGLDPIRGKEVGKDSPLFGALAERVRAHPTLKARIERDTKTNVDALSADRVVAWFRAQKSDPTILIELAGLRT
jgi:hypothetical protein